MSEHPPNKSWAYAIRRNVYELLFLLVLFAVVATGYRVWFQSTLDGMKSVANEYHLSCYSNYLKASEALRKLQNLLALDEFEASVGGVLKNGGHLLGSKPGLFYVAKDNIQVSLGMDKSRNYPEFKIVGGKLDAGLHEFSVQFDKFSSKDVSVSDLNADLLELLAVLEQISKLHYLSYQAHLAEIRSFEILHTTWFNGIAFVLVLVSLFVSHRSIRSISEVSLRQKEAEVLIRYQANYDNLTGLPNRLLSIDILEKSLLQAVRRKSQSAVLFMDLDDFKKVNDTLGHSVGDELLKEIGIRLKSVLRSSDTVGRFGGDEFVIILDYISKASDATLLASNIIKALKTPFNLNKRELLLSASIGISIFPDDGETVEELLRNADSAMYHSKDIGRGTYSYFTESMNRDASRRLLIEEHLHEAINREELSVYFQPLIDLCSDEVIGMEALVRWKNSELGVVNPAEFIPVAEQTGLIIPVGEFVLVQALRSLREWNKLIKDLRMSINLSPRQFRDLELVSTIKKKAGEYGVSPLCIDLEITEGVLLSGYPKIDNSLKELDDMGFNLVMDDFGTGYSSLSYLRKYPFDTIKIDRSFVTDITDSSAAAGLVEAAIHMARSLGLKVVAEGVEKEDQLAALKSMGCDFAQGFYLGRPKPFEETSQLLSLGLPWVKRESGRKMSG